MASTVTSGAGTDAADAAPAQWPWQLEMWTNIQCKTQWGKRMYTGKCTLCGFNQVNPTTLARVVNHYGK